jgi:hypothetical protein
MILSSHAYDSQGLIVTVFWEERDCIVCLEMRADELMRHLISGELANYRIVRTSPKPLHYSTTSKVSSAKRVPRIITMIPQKFPPSNSTRTQYFLMIF